MTIPTLDCAQQGTDPDGFARDLGRACRETGFFLLNNHGVPDAMIAQVFDQAARFFALGEAGKRPLSIATNPHNRKWAYLGSESPDEFSGQTDRQEAFNIGLDLPADDSRVLPPPLRAPVGRVLSGPDPGCACRGPARHRRREILRDHGRRVSARAAERDLQHMRAR